MSDTTTAKDISTIKDSKIRRQLIELCTEYREDSVVESAAKKRKEAKMVAIKALAKKVRAYNHKGDGFHLQRQLGITSKIVQEKLLELGVEMEVIEEATEETPYERWQVMGDRTKKAAANGDNSNEDGG